MKTPFASVWVTPDYQAGRAVVRWTLRKPRSGVEIYVAKSPTGGPPWKLLNPGAPVSGLDYFIDDTFEGSAIRSTHYRLGTLDDNGALTSSPAVGPLSRLTLEGYKALAIALRDERKYMSGGSGVQVWLFQVKPGLSEGADEITGQTVTTGGDPDANFMTPIFTWVLPLSQRTIKKEDAQDGLSGTQETTQRFRFLAFPNPLPGDVIVIPETDVRWVLTGDVQSYDLLGKVPVAHECNAMRLSPGDTRYKLITPEVAV